MILERYMAKLDLKITVSLQVFEISRTMLYFIIQQKKIRFYNIPQKTNPQNMMNMGA